MKYILILLALLLTSCTPDELEVCGIINGGGYNNINNTYYLKIDNTRHRVDMKTYESFYVGDYVCLE